MEKPAEIKKASAAGNAPGISPEIPIGKRIGAWLVHGFTATGAIFGLLALDAIGRGKYYYALWMMAGAIFVDAVDGTLARRAQVKAAAPQIDGALLDNLLDYANYVIVPAYFMIAAKLLPYGWRFTSAALVALASAYQFTQVDAKTEDHFFKGFPSYWNIMVMYLYLWETSEWTNLFVVLGLCVLIFIPVKYVYPSRLEYLTHNRWLRLAMLAATIVWMAVTAILLWIYPLTYNILRILSIGYIVLYIAVSVYRTFVPLEGKED